LNGIWRLAETFEKGIISHSNCCSCTDPLLITESNWDTSKNFLIMIYLNAVSPSQYNTAQCGWVIGEQLKRMWKELVVA